MTYAPMPIHPPTNICPGFDAALTARAYDRAAREHFGEFALTNF